MNKNLTITTVLIGTMLVSITSYAADTDADSSSSSSSSAKTYVKDSVITTKVKAKLADAKLRTLAHVSVSTNDQGAVTLTGTAKTQEGVDKAGELAKSVEGVTSVQNDIKVVAENK